MIKPNERFHFNNPILKTSKLGLIGLSVYNLGFNITERNNHLIYVSSKISTITPRAYELADLGDIIREETNNKV